MHWKDSQQTATEWVPVKNLRGHQRLRGTAETETWMSFSNSVYIKHFQSPTFFIAFQLLLFRFILNKASVMGLCLPIVKRPLLNQACHNLMNTQLFSRGNRIFDPKDWMRIPIQ